MTGLDKKTDFFSIHCRGSWRRKGQRSAVLDGCMHSHVDVCSRMFWAVSQPRGAGHSRVAPAVSWLSSMLCGVT